MMNCIIVDDEPLAADLISGYVHQIEYLNLVAVCRKPMEAINILGDQKIDLVFLDIEMPQLTGIELVKTISNMPLFIFITAYPQYALDGFNLNAIDYLVKPIPLQRFIASVTKARELFLLKKSDDKISTADDLSLPFIFVRSEHQNIKINIDEITHIQGLKDYIKIYTCTSGKAIFTLSNFKDILEKLPRSRFLRVHRSYVVNMAFLSVLRKNSLIIHGDLLIPIGETFKDEVHKRLGLG
tara:strand:- start:1686 stop:2405 length:720 start_codon:yes stop_codon:yes gene_type:complete